MVLTEEEAKTKTCPHLRYCENPYHVAADRDPPVYSHQRCEGSGCMAWAWLDPHSDIEVRRGTCGLNPYMGIR